MTSFYRMIYRSSYFGGTGTRTRTTQTRTCVTRIIWSARLGAICDRYGSSLVVIAHQLQEKELARIILTRHFLSVFKVADNCQVLRKKYIENIIDTQERKRENRKWKQRLRVTQISVCVSWNNFSILFSCFLTFFTYLMHFTTLFLLRRKIPKSESLFDL